MQHESACIRMLCKVAGNRRPTVCEATVTMGSDLVFWECGFSKECAREGNVVRKPLWLCFQAVLVLCQGSSTVNREPLISGSGDQKRGKRCLP